MGSAYRTIPALSDNDLVRFHSKYTMLWPGGCWEWHTGKTTCGYGRFVLNNQSFRANRCAYFVFTGTDPGPLQVQHTCNNRLCVCPLHLTLGTHKQNSEYMVLCGRQGSVVKPEAVIRRGEDNGQAKLTRAQVLKILDIRASGKLTLLQIAEQFGVSQSLIFMITKGQKWEEVFNEFNSRPHLEGGHT